ncbi:g133 [Coccomyxa elongata]
MSGLLHRLGFIIRETGQALDRLGCRLQGNNAFLEDVYKHRTIMSLGSKTANIGEGAFVAPSAAVIGDVTLGKRSSVWYGTVLRGDEGAISIGNNSNLQDNVSVRTSKAFLGGHNGATTIGNNVTVGHSVLLDCVTIQDEALIGMGATLLEGVKVEKGAQVAAGAVVAPGTVIPSGELWGGNPAKLLRPLKPEEAAFISKSAQTYAELGAEHAKEVALGH